jgi:3-oxoacyl-[acyl-carrier-protein] synthase III
MITSKITGTGSYIPELQIENSFFGNAEFFETDGKRVQKDNAIVIEKFAEITGIKERRYARKDQVASDLGFLAAQSAIENAAIDKETIDYIIVAHNFGDVAHDTKSVTQVPSLSSKIKALLQIHNPDCVAYDLPFGCPGWVEGLIQANYFIRSGDARRCLVIGAETLSRVVDAHDRDSMIFSDGAGAVVMEASDSNSSGILSHKTQTHAVKDVGLLSMGPSNNQASAFNTDLMIKMQGRKVYEFALKHVPLVIKTALDKANVSLSQVNKILIHQANEKMDNAIADRLFELYGLPVAQDAIPMTIGFLGNSSVATVPTMLDLILRGQLEGHKINKGDVVVFASVGAGMNINAVVYRV